MIQIGIEDENSPIYRIISVKRFLQILNEKRIPFVRPELWHDPFENFFIRYVPSNYFEDRAIEWAKKWFEDQGEKLVIDSSGKNKIKIVFGQCWTRNVENDVMWRIYTPNEDAVKLKSTAQKMTDLYLRNEHEKPRGFGFVSGKVMYFSVEGLLEDINDTLRKPLLNVQNDIVIRPLLIKRDAFKHEEEIRFIVTVYKKALDLDPGMANLDVLKMDCDPNDFIEDVVLDPRLSQEDYLNYAEIFRKLGFTNPITKSTLYDPPNLNSIIR